jgi:rubrerythrin
MPNFTDPFPGIKETRPMNESDLIKALKLDLAAELDAAELYQSHINSTGNSLVMRVLGGIRDEEKVHAGELLKLIEILDPGEKKFLENGAAEVENFKEFAQNWR